MEIYSDRFFWGNLLAKKQSWVSDDSPTCIFG